MGRETDPLMASGLHRLLGLLPLPQDVIHPVNRSIGQGEDGEWHLSMGEESAP